MILSTLTVVYLGLVLGPALFDQCSKETQLKERLGQMDQELSKVRIVITRSIKL